MAGARPSSIKLLALLSSAGVSLAPVAGVVTAAGIMLAPASALALNDCGVGTPADNGATADSYSCAAGNYPIGITYASAGDLTVTTLGAVTVNAPGINLLGNTTDSVTLNTSAGLVTGTAGPVIDVATTSGAINISTAGITGTNINVTHGILAVSTSGPITIATNGAVNINSTTAGALQQAAISATTSGAIDVTAAGSTVTGRVYGIDVHNTGNGAITVNANSAITMTTTTGVAVAAIDTSSTGTGATTINVGTGSGTVNGQAGAAIRTDSSGTQTITVASGRTVSTTAASTAGTINLTGAGAKTITNAGTINGSTTGTAILANSGSTLTLTNTGTITGRLTSSAITGASTFTNSGTWNTNGANTFSAGASTLTNSGTVTAAAASTFTGLETLTNSGTFTLGNGSTLTVTAFTNTGNFNSGTSSTINGPATFTNGGTFTLGSGSSYAAMTTLTNTGAFTASGNLVGLTTLTNSGTFTTASTTDVSNLATVTNSGTLTLADIAYTDLATLTNSGTLTVTGDIELPALSTFNNSGTIALGAVTRRLAADDGIDFNASGDSLITTTVNLTGGGQADCSAATVAGCLYIPGATVSGVTNVRVTTSSTTDTYTTDPIVLVDVSGGTSAAGDFILSSDSSNYVVDPGLGGVIATEGLFAYALTYDDAEQQHELVSVPRLAAFELVPLMGQVLTVWHTSAEAIVGRQGDLNVGRGGGMWVRVIRDVSERDYAPSFSAGAMTFNIDAGYKQVTTAAIAGFDFSSDTTGFENVLLGFHGGVVLTEGEFANSDAIDEMDGVTVGVHGGLTSGAFTLDGLVNANLLNLDRTDPALGDVSTSVIAFGGRADAGWMMNLGSIFVQPLLSGAFVNAEVKDLMPGSYTVTYNDVQSMRGGVGVRVGSVANEGVGFWVTGRAWKEFADEANIGIQMTDAETFVIMDEMSDSFQELSGGVRFGLREGLTAFAQAGVQFHDEIDNVNGSFGVRWSW